jgi:hypothetical protein
MQSKINDYSEKTVSFSEHQRTLGNPAGELECVCGQAAVRPLFAV